MIPKRIDRQPGNDNFRALALYAADAKIGRETGEKTLMHWHEGCMAENYMDAIMEVEVTQAKNTRTAKEKTYHLMVSFHPEDETKLTPKIFKEIEKELAKAIGFSGHQRLCGVHKNTNNIHMHIAYNMINPVKFYRYEPFRDYPVQELAGPWLWLKLEPSLGPRWASMAGSLAGLVLGWGGFKAAGTAYKAVRGLEGLGDGDPPLLGLLGAFLGWRALPLVITAASLTSLVYALILMSLGNGEKPPGGWRLKPLPFGPFLVLGAFLQVSIGPAFLNWYWNLAV